MVDHQTAQQAAEAAVHAAQAARIVVMTQPAKGLWDTTAGGALIGGALALLGVIVTNVIQWLRERANRSDELLWQRAIVKALFSDIFIGLRKLLETSPETQQPFLENFKPGSDSADMLRDHWEMNTRVLGEQVFNTATSAAFKHSTVLYPKIVRTTNALLGTYMVMKNKREGRSLVDARLVRDLAKSVQDIPFEIDAYESSIRPWWNWRPKESQLSQSEHTKSQG